MTNKGVPENMLRRNRQAFADGRYVAKFQYALQICNIMRIGAGVVLEEPASDRGADYGAEYVNDGAAPPVSGGGRQMRFLSAAVMSFASPEAAVNLTSHVPPLPVKGQPALTWTRSMIA